jgi:hypothetical protein
MLLHRGGYRTGDATRGIATRATSSEEVLGAELDERFALASGGVAAGDRSQAMSSSSNRRKAVEG